MSSLAATQADGYYIPAAYYDNTKAGKKPPTKNQVAAAKIGNNKKSVGHNQFLQHGMVRFELPYSGMCQHCQQYIGRGTRYNAQKILNTEEKYHSSKIWKFVMQCRNCHIQEFIIQTNPREFGFDYLQGITKLQYKKEVVATTTSTDAAANHETTISSSLQQLERMAHGQRHAMTEYDELQALQQWNTKTYHLDADVNATIRSKFRQERNAHRRRIAQGQEQYGWIKSNLPLLDNDDDNDNDDTGDTHIFQQQARASSQQPNDRYRQVQSSRIFETTSAARKTTSRRKRKSSPPPQPIQESSLSPSSSSSLRASRTTIPDRVESNATTTTTTIVLPNGIAAATQQQQPSADTTKRVRKRRVIVSVQKAPMTCHTPVQAAAFTSTSNSNHHHGNELRSIEDGDYQPSATERQLSSSASSLPLPTFAFHSTTSSCKPLAEAREYPSDGMHDHDDINGSTVVDLPIVGDKFKKEVANTTTDTCSTATTTKATKFLLMMSAYASSSSDDDDG